MASQAQMQDYLERAHMKVLGKAFRILAKSLHLIEWGEGAPTGTPASLVYINVDGVTTTTIIYVNVNGTWTALTIA